VCTVALRLADPGTTPWPLLLAAVRDEFLGRPWDPPGRHWPQSAPGVVAGRDRVAHGTWLAVRPPSAASPEPAMAALLNGVRLDPAPYGARPSRGALPLTVLAGGDGPVEADVAGYDGFHLLYGTPAGAVVWTWDGERLVRRDLEPGDHVIVNAGVDRRDAPVVDALWPSLRALPTPDLSSERDTAAAWGEWATLLRGDGRPGDDPGALIVRRTYGDLVYGSSSASLVALGSGRARFDFTATPERPDWYTVDLGRETPERGPAIAA
jgi:hypothetical protein